MNSSDLTKFIIRALEVFSFVSEVHIKENLFHTIKHTLYPKPQPPFTTSSLEERMRERESDRERDIDRDNK